MARPSANKPEPIQSEDETELTPEEIALSEHLEISALFPVQLPMHVPDVALHVEEQKQNGVYIIDRKGYKHPNAEQG